MHLQLLCCHTRCDHEHFPKSKTCTLAQALANADFVVEAIKEDEDVKKSAFSLLDNVRILLRPFEWSQAPHCTPGLTLLRL